MLCHSHVDYIISLEIDFSRAACPLNHNGIIFPVQPCQGILYSPKGFQGISLVVLPGRHIAHRLAHNNHLGLGIPRRLQKHRIHICHRLQPCRLCLRHLRPAHFIPLAGYIGIQGHILRLKRNHPAPLPVQYAAQSRCQDAFPHMGAGSHHHNIICHKRPPLL